MSIRYARPEYNGTVVYLLALDATTYARATRERVPHGLPDLEKVPVAARYRRRPPPLFW